MASRSEGLPDGWDIGAGRGVGEEERGQAMGLSRVLPRPVELALEVWLGDLDVPQGHADIFVSQQLHESGKTDAEAEHLRSEAVAAMPRSAWASHLRR
jgi:hypothetical protein